MSAVTRAQIDNEINVQMPNNTSNLISPAVQRGVLHDLVSFAAAPYNVQNFGATGNGSTDDSAAILACVNAAYTAGGSVYFPAGVYMITQSAVLTQTVATSGHGITYRGDGSQTSILILNVESAVADMYFYDNGSTPRELYSRFFDLGFQGFIPGGFTGASSIRNHAKGFRLWATTATGSHEQNFHFTRCEFGYLNNVFETAGDNTTSENSWVQCDAYQIKGSVLSLNNVQSFNHEFHATNLTDIYGSTFLVSGNGGGAIKMYGGSVILDSDLGSNTNFFNGQSSPGQGAYPITINGVRFETRGNFTNILNITNTTQFEVTFNNCLFEEQGSSNKNDYCDVGSYSHVQFNDCIFYQLSGTKIFFNVFDGNLYNETGAIVFDSCGFPVDFSDQMFVSNYGRITARNCYGSDNVGAESAGQHWAHDFDCRLDNPAGLYTAWTNGTASIGSPTDNNMVLKVACMISGTHAWPNSGNDLQLKLPRNAIIKNIHLRKPSGGADATVCTLNVSRNDKSGSPHLTSNSVAYTSAQTGDTTTYFYNVGNSVNERNLRLYTSVATTSAAAGGFCIVEYY